MENGWQLGKWVTDVTARASTWGPAGTRPPSCPPLQGVWNPALLAIEAAGGPIQPNDVHLGGARGGGSGSAAQPGLLLLTGANSGGKSTLLRATCLAAVMAQVRWWVG